MNNIDKQHSSKHDTPAYRQPFIPTMSCIGLMMVYAAGMWLLTAYLPDVIEGFRRSNLFSLLVPGYTYLMAIIMVLITPITYFKRKGNIEKKFLWLFVSGMSFFFAWFMLYMSTYF